MEEYASRSGFPHSKRWHGHASYTHILIVPTDKAKCYPPALRNVLLTVEHRRSKYLNNGLERDHQHLKQRLYPMRGFKRAASAELVARGHAFVQIRGRGGGGGEGDAEVIVVGP